MREQLESRLREAIAGPVPSPELCERAVDTGLRRRQRVRVALGASLVATVVIATGTVLFLAFPRFSPKPSGPSAILSATQRVETPVFSGPISAADHAATWTILSIEGANSP